MLQRLIVALWRPMAHSAAALDSPPEPTDAKRPVAAPPAAAPSPPTPREVGGREGPDPTRYGDWEKSGRCIDF